METDSNSDGEMMPAAAQIPPYSRANIELLIRRHQAAVTALGLAFNGPPHHHRPMMANAATSVPAPKHHTIDAILGLKRNDQKDQESGGKYTMLCSIKVLYIGTKYLYCDEIKRDRHMNII